MRWRAWVPDTLILSTIMFMSAMAVMADHQTMGQECVCERRLKPVCSNEGRTYENMCLFDCSKRLRPALSIQYTGSCCPPSSLCPSHYSPVCDNYGSIHENECHFEYQKCLARKMYGVMLKINATGVCDENVEPEVEVEEFSSKICEFECPNEIDQLCDNRGITHKNQCFFEKQLCKLHSKKLPLVSIAHKGKCEERVKSPKTAQPIFGAVIHEIGSESVNEESQNEDATKFFQHQPDPFIDANPYDSFVSSIPQQKQFSNQTTTIQTSTISTQQTTISSTSSTQYALVDHDSARPNRTFDDTDFTDGPQCSAIECYKKWDPVCDTKNQTHRSECLFSFRVCKLKKEGISVNLPEILHRGQCAGNPFPLPTQPLAAQLQPLPSLQPQIPLRSQSNISSNPQPQSTFQQLPSQPAIHKTKNLAREGFCRVCNVQEETQKVCTNANQTFLNACDLAQWNCERRSHGLEEQILVHVGACRNNSLVFNMQNEVCPATCPRHYKPVCDSDGTTFPNLCTFQMVNCHERKMKKPDHTWLVALRECPQPDAPVDNTNDQQQIVSTLSPTLASTVPQVKGGVNETVEENTFVCPEPNCPDDDDPVCDQEGTVHKNECQFTRARCLAAKVGRSLHAVSDEECPSSKCRILTTKPCPTDYDPICATDFRTLPNTCAFERIKCQDQELDVLFKGECSQCLKAPCPILDEKDVDDKKFLCDQNGETKSKCEFEMVRCIYEIKFGYNITAAYEGKCCPSFESCPTTNEPICDTNKKEHRNLCDFNIANCRAVKIERSKPIGIFRNESCTAPPPKPIQKTSNNNATSLLPKNPLCIQPLPLCTDIYDPVCGSDHQTYPNECQFIAQMCNNTQKHLRMLYRGACCRDECSDEPSPVCDNEAKTHLNLCKFGYQRCLASRLDGKNLTVVTYSSCLDDSCNIHCPQVYQPVCAKNGKTYVNECEIKKLNCFMQKHNTTSRLLEVDYPQECCPRKECVKSFEPVCDEKHNVFANLCEFNFQQCIQLKRTGTVLQMSHNMTECFEGKNNKTAIHSASFPRQ